jgi:UDP-2-acetamido-3-amino-2,3-dideoxy-glucuronate N-acetyltransferase
MITKHSYQGDKPPYASMAKADGTTPSPRCCGVKLLKFPLITDPRGNLMFAEFPTHLPFQPKRFFVTYDVPTESVRGEHAHKQLEQLIVCLKGSLTVTVDDGGIRERYVLDSPEVGIYIPPLIWGIQSNHSTDCVMLVLASDVYAESGYLRNYDDFQACLKTARTASGENQGDITPTSPA